MKKNTFTLFLILCCYFSYGQTFQDCITIDFESIPGATPAEGLIINDQFLDTFGLSFSLETGGFPVIAAVGGNQTAFGSVYGPDTPAPNQNIGTFFLTDDGVLAGLNAPPIILNFEVPVDSFSGCILDMDFGEIFIIHAKDINEQIILQDTVFSTDPGTGDGVATCWGFNLEGCEGSVYSIRFEGQRTQSGAFGMGLDNLVFCLSGIDIANAIQIERNFVGCDGSLGSINIINTSNETFLYSIDGVNFQTSPVFENLEVGLYTITVQDEDGCAAEIEGIFVEGASYSALTQVNANNASCDFDNGSIEVLVNNPEGITYSIDGINFQTNPIFENLDDGTYTVVMKDSLGCLSQQTVTIENVNLTISNLFETHTTCNDPNGILQVTTSYVDGVSYSIDGVNFQESPIFTDLPPGEYTLFIEDDTGCMDSQMATILPSDPVLMEINATTDWCNDANGSLSIQASGGSGNYQYYLDDGTPQTSSNFVDLLGNTYTAYAVDDAGCMAEAPAIVPLGNPILVSNIQAIDPSCDNVFGSIVLDAVGGNGLVYYALNGNPSTNNPAFYNLDAGEFSVVITDSEGCQDSLQTSLEYPNCPVYIPNAFSPENDGINDFFEIFTNSNYDVEVLRYSIYDRWGEHLWEKTNFTIHTADNSLWWNGIFRGQPCMIGVYVYVIEVRYFNGSTELFAGDVTLVR